MKAPKALEKKYSRDRSLKAFVNDSLANIADLVTDQPKFFPDYTDHGVKHIEETIQTAFEIPQAYPRSRRRAVGDRGYPPDTALGRIIFQSFE